MKFEKYFNSFYELWSNSFHEFLTSLEFTFVHFHRFCLNNYIIFLTGFHRSPVVISIPESHPCNCAKEKNNYTYFLQTFEILILAFSLRHATTFSIQIFHVITNLEGNHFGLGESTALSHQKSQTSKIKEVDISIFLGYYVLY